MKAYLNGVPYVSGGGSSDEVYSTEETRIGTWIDGKPLYRRVVIVPSLSISSSLNTTQLSGISLPNVRMVFCSGAGVLPSGYGITIPYSDDGIFVAVQYSSSGNTLALRHKWFSGGTILTDIELCVEYTKTADTGGAAR